MNSARAFPGFLLAIGLGMLLLAGCSLDQKMRGDGFSDSENWGQELRKQAANGASFGGVTTKANQIERNLGVR